MIRAGILGATGYTGLELVRLLTSHPDVDIAFVTARSHAGRLLSQVHPSAPPIPLIDTAEADLAAADVLFLCLPHGAAQSATRAGLDAGRVVIDLSADHRLRRAEDYRTWYGVEHAHPALLAEAVYGLTERRRDAVRNARLIANPGCYPTSILLGLAPLLEDGLLAGATIVADSKSGTSGAGRSASVAQLFAEVNENLRPYNVGHVHRHVAEIEQELAQLGATAPPRGIVFSPHLIPVTRGIVSTMYVPAAALGTDVGALRDRYARMYGETPFVRLLSDGETATLAHVVRTNRCAISLHPVPERDMLIVVSAIDNLLKGAAGQAVQNMNVRFGLHETAGLL